jgi:hypothetical protein
MVTNGSGARCAPGNVARIRAASPCCWGASPSPLAPPVRAPAAAAAGEVARLPTLEDAGETAAAAAEEEEEEEEEEEPLVGE